MLHFRMALSFVMNNKPPRFRHERSRRGECSATSCRSVSPRSSEYVRSGQASGAGRARQSWHASSYPWCHSTFDCRRTAHGKPKVLILLLSSHQTASKAVANNEAKVEAVLQAVQASMLGIIIAHGPTRLVWPVLTLARTHLSVQVMPRETPFEDAKR